MSDTKDLGNGWVLRRPDSDGNGEWAASSALILGQIVWSALEARDQQIAQLINRQHMLEAAVGNRNDQIATLAQEVDKHGLTDQQIAALQEVAEAAETVVNDECPYSDDDLVLRQTPKSYECLKALFDALAKARALGALKEE